MKKYLFIISLTLCIGLILVGITLFYIFSYFADIQNSVRYEYIQGAIITAMFSTPFWITASVLLFQIKESISKKLFRTVNTITAVLLIIVVFISIYPIVMIVLGK